MIVLSLDNMSVEIEEVELVGQDQHQLHAYQYGAYDESLPFLKLVLYATSGHSLLHDVANQEDKRYGEADAEYNHLHQHRFD